MDQLFSWHRKINADIIHFWHYQTSMAASWNFVNKKVNFKLFHLTLHCVYIYQSIARYKSTKIDKNSQLDSTSRNLLVWKQEPMRRLFVQVPNCYVKYHGMMLQWRDHKRGRNLCIMMPSRNRYGVSNRLIYSTAEYWILLCLSDVILMPC